MQINQTTLQNLYKGFRTIFLEAYHGATDGIIWPSIAMRTESSAESEEYDWLGAVPGLRELVGEVQIRNLKAHKVIISNKEYESTVGVKRAKIERDTYGTYNPLMQAMGIAAKQHPDELVAGLLAGGFTAPSYTGKNFFDVNHEPIAGGTKFSNKGTKKLSQTNFRTAKANLLGRLNGEGRAMKLGRKLLLIVSPTYEGTAREITEAEKIGNNTNIDRGTATTVVYPELMALNEHAWFLVETGYPVRPLIVQIEKEANLASVTNPDDSHVVLHQEFIYQAYARHGAGYGLPELAYGSTGADAA
jgi:phage major head subunit gpT-like protein